MKKIRVITLLTFMAMVALFLNQAVIAAPLNQDGPVATARASAAEITWQPKGDYAAIVLTVSMPDGEVIRKEFAAGATPTLRATDGRGGRLADGSYNYELRLTPNFAPGVREALQAARKNGNEQEVVRDLRARGVLPKDETTQSGSFMVVNGAIVMGGETEGSQRIGRSNSLVEESETIARESRYQPFTSLLRPVSASASRRSAFSSAPPTSLRAMATRAAIRMFDQVIPDDLIVQSSLCVGFDCVNNESFGFDTIRLKENNTRLKFEDTSTGAGFPSTDWQLTANDSASGGANKFSIEDITAARVPFTITGGAPTNSIFVDSTGRVGFRTSTPVMELHSSDTDTPTLRLEQTNAGGFTAQTWDVAGNEANFFIRDVTGGSRLSFRIRPGAPTSSIDIAADGKVGMGTGSPTQNLHVFRNSDELHTLLVENDANGTTSAASVAVQSDTAGTNFNAHSPARTVSRFGVTIGGWSELLNTAGNGLILGTLGSAPMILGTNSANRMTIVAGGNIGFGGQAAPAHPIHHQNGAHLTAGGNWTNASSRALKNNIHNLTASQALRTLQALNPVTFEYNAEPGEKHVGFIAEDVPELVATSDRKSLSSMDVVAVLTKVVQEQQKMISELKEKVERLEKPRAKKARYAKRKAKAASTTR